MSKVRYYNKKANRILVYEYTPHTDPVTNKSKPIRKYIGYEDPITHVFTASSGKPGRPKRISAEVDQSAQQDREQELYASLYAEIRTLKESLSSANERIDTLFMERKTFVNQISDYKHLLSSIKKMLDQAPGLV